MNAARLLDRIETHLQRWLAEWREEADNLRRSVLFVRELRVPEPPIGPEMVSICSWCPELHILRIERGPRDNIAIYQRGNEVHVYRNTQRLEITNGMCPECLARMRGGHPRSEGE